MNSLRPPFEMIRPPRVSAPQGREEALRDE